MPQQPHTPSASETPDNVVAKRISDKLLAAGLIPASKLAEFTTRLAAGMKEVEWKLFLDLAFDDAQEGIQDG